MLVPDITSDSSALASPSPLSPRACAPANACWKALLLRILENRLNLAMKFQCLKKLICSNWGHLCSTLCDSPGRNAWGWLISLTAGQSSAAVEHCLLSWECDTLSTGTALPFSCPQQRPYSYACTAKRSFPRVHYRPSSDVSTHVLKSCFREGGPPGYKSLIQYKQGIVTYDPFSKGGIASVGVLAIKVLILQVSDIFLEHAA